MTELIGQAAYEPSGPIGIKWPDAIKGPWNVRAYWIDVDGEPTLVGLELCRGVNLLHDGPATVVIDTSSAQRPPGGFSAQAFRDFNFGDVLKKLLEQESRRAEWVERWTAQVPDGPQARLIRERGVDVKRASGAGVWEGSDRDREVATVYLAALAAGNYPTQAVKERFTVSTATAGRMVARCRGLGLLPATTPGVPSRPTTPTRRKAKTTTTKTTKSKGRRTHGK